MSELINNRDNRVTIRWKLLTGASALALTAYVSAAAAAKAEDSSQPQLWIELGGQLSQLDDGQQIFAPVFRNSPPRPSIFVPSQKFEKPPLYSIDEFGALSFQPDGSDWLFSASIRYGRSASNRRISQQTQPAPVVKYISYSGNPVRRAQYHSAAKFADTTAQQSERHVILDFTAGRDFGLGMFGEANSTVNLGVRFAQFNSKTNIAINSDPDAHPTYKYVSHYASGFKTAHGGPGKFFLGGHYHLNAASLNATRTFHGLGPSISWNGAASVAGNTKDGEIALDWGVNAALLFGRQRAKVHHQTTSRYHHGKYNQYNLPTTPYRNAPPDRIRSRSVTVPNLGGSVGLSYRIEDFKVSMGYRADFFFNAMDGGIDARKSENRAFFGPYASISVGIGD